MLSTYRFRLYPTKTQARLMNETLEKCRLLFNNMLADKRENRTGFYEQKRKLVGMKRGDKFLKAVHSQVLQDVVLRLDKAYQGSSVGLAKRPIVFEDLRIPNMSKNHNLASAILDASWGQLRQLTAYKAERHGGRVILVDPRGTSQKCSECGEVVPKELSERVHDCPKCGLAVDRDVNVARNILKAGLERARAEAEPLLVQRRRISKFGR